ncbi:MAG: hypothetical protein ACO1SV_15055 [Fimbriimonas sp.]
MASLGLLWAVPGLSMERANAAARVQVVALLGNGAVGAAKPRINEELAVLTKEHGRIEVFRIEKSFAIPFLGPTHVEGVVRRERGTFRFRAMSSSGKPIGHYSEWQDARVTPQAL